jgi:hypothetical protein
MSRIAISKFVRERFLKTRLLAAEGAMIQIRFLFVLDACLFTALMAAESVPLTGAAIHEWLGLLVAILLLIHITLQWPWFASAVRRLGVGGYARTRVNLLLNASLFADVILVIFSGAMISQIALPALGLRASTNFAWNGIHSFSQQAMIFLVGLHIALNWSWIRAVVVRLFFAGLSRRSRNMETAARPLSQTDRGSNA